MNNYAYVIIGGGSAGFAAAIRASELKASTALVNAGLPLGGTCVNVGCVPSKHLLAVGAALKELSLPAFEAIRSRGHQFDFPAAIAAKERLIGAMRAEKYEKVLAALENVALYQGTARFISPHEIEVDGTTIQGEKFLIATGSSPQIIPFPGINEIDYLTSKEALSLSELPDSMIIIGGRAVALEFAQMYARFGTKVTILQRSLRLIPEHEPLLGEALRRYLEDEGISIYTGVEVKRLQREGSATAIEFVTEGHSHTISGDKLLMATGVKGNTAELGLEAAGVEIGKGGFVKTNKFLRTTAPHIFAAGDVAGTLQLETVAAKAGKIATENALLGTEQHIDYDQVPAAIFTSPEVATVGLTEEEAEKRYGTCACRVLWTKDVPKARAVNDTQGLIKMVVSPDSGKVLGVHLLASRAADIIHEAALAVKFGLTVDDIIDTLHVFPTMSEAIKLVAQSFRRDVSRMSCCVE